MSTATGDHRWGARRALRGTLLVAPAAMALVSVIALTAWPGVAVGQAQSPDSAGRFELEIPPGFRILESGCDEWSWEYLHEATAGSRIE